MALPCGKRRKGGSLNRAKVRQPTICDVSNSLFKAVQLQMIVDVK